ncbi:MAG: hypothetical protein IKV97_01220 [Clostridia bacterium]|nr:hypothetical protein [Clostridia bacterium]
MPKNNFVCDLSDISDAEQRVLDRILSSISAGNHAHSFIIDGGSAISRFRCAICVACALVCEDKRGVMPCMTCSQCLKILCGDHTDIKTLGEEDDVRVDDIRAISKEAYILPTDCEYHVYILKSADRMNSFAQNALLKIMEEPPKNTVFILLSPSKELLLPTVVSRAQALTLGKSSLDEMEKALCAKFPNISPQAARRAARLQSGMDKIELDAGSLKTADAAYDTVHSFYVEKQYRINEALPKTRDALVFTLSILAMAARDIAVDKNTANAQLLFSKEGKTLNLQSLTFLLSVQWSFMRYSQMLQNVLIMREIRHLCLQNCLPRSENDRILRKVINN